MSGTFDDPPLPSTIRRSGSPQIRTPRRARAAHPKDTPSVRTANGAGADFLRQIAPDRYKQYSKESEKWIVGPMPKYEFLKEFLPCDSHLGMPSSLGAFDTVPDNASEETAIYTPLIASIDSLERCPSVKFFDTSTLSEDSGHGSFKPDICGYSEDEVEFVRRPKSGKIPANLGFAEIFIEVKTGLDMLKDPDPNLSKEERVDHNFVASHSYVSRKDQERARSALGQNVAYAAEACARQHRAFYFSLSIVGSTARFIRWDRSGAIVSEAFDYREDPELLCVFLWRFGLASPVQRGYDSSVVVASDAEENLFREVISENVAFQLDTKDTKKLKDAVAYHYEPGKVTKMDVYNEAQQVLEQYLVSRPVKSPVSMAGRSTRGYWAVKLVDLGGEIAFLKDTWRVDVPNMETEGSIYDSMAGKDVVNISDLFCYGNVPDDTDELFEKLEAGDAQVEVQGRQNELELAPEDARNESETSNDQGQYVPMAQCTRTNEFADADWACKGCKGGLQVVKHTHYRMTLKEVGYPLKEFTGTRELFDGTGDALEALTEANEKCGRLHRDVSLDNIILVRDKKTGRRRGILIDWELSTVTDGKGKARDYFRSGTWAYMSIAALSGDENFRHSNADDMESVLYVVLYCAVRWLPHNKAEDLGLWIHEFFDFHTTFLGRERGGAIKSQYILNGQFTKEFEFTEDSVQLFFRTAYDYLFTRSRPMSGDMLWVAKNVRKLFDVIRKNPLPDNDRVEHEVDDFLKTIAPNTHATRTSIVEGTSKRSASGRLTAGSSRGTSKRTLDETNEGQSRASGTAALEEPQRDSKRKRNDTNEGQSVVTGEGTNGRVSRKNSSRKQSTRRNSPVTNEKPSAATRARSSSRHTKSGGRASRRNSTGKQGQRQSPRLAAKSSSSSIKRGS